VTIWEWGEKKKKDDSFSENKYATLSSIKYNSEINP
jgi:hypothetical protein